MSAPRGFVSLLDMLKLPLGILLARSTEMANLASMLEPHVVAHDSWQIDGEMFNGVAGRAREFIDALNAAGLTVTAVAAQDFADHWNGMPTVDGQLVSSGGHLRSIASGARSIPTTLKREAKTKVAMVMSPAEVALYEPQHPLWGVHVRGQFPSATKDIDEAAKCLALGRSTAAVFHAMRIMEVALHAVRQCLGVAQSGRNWGDALKDIREERVKRGGNKWAKNDFFQDVYGRLDAIKDAWRNTTMHVDNVYTEEDAARIFDYTKGFMEKIASQMDESGAPLA